MGAEAGGRGAMNIKKINQSRHARQRAEQRFNLVVNHAEMRQAVKDIQQGRAVFIDRQSCRVTRWKVLVTGSVVTGIPITVEVVAVYDSKRKSIATFLTMEMVERDMARARGLNSPEGTDNTLCS